MTSIKSYSLIRQGFWQILRLLPTLAKYFLCKAIANLRKIFIVRRACSEWKTFEFFVVEIKFYVLIKFRLIFFSVRTYSPPFRVIFLQVSRWQLIASAIIIFPFTLRISSICWNVGISFVFSWIFSSNLLPLQQLFSVHQTENPAHGRLGRNFCYAEVFCQKFWSVFCKNHYFAKLSKKFMKRPYFYSQFPSKGDSEKLFKSSFVSAIVILFFNAKIIKLSHSLRTYNFSTSA